MEFLSDARQDVYRPSIFELIAQEQLRDLLQPAVKYVLGVFAQRYPRYLIRLFNKHEEFYAAIMLVVERHYLKTHGASFSENFYGLNRRRRPLIETEKANLAVGRGSEPNKLKDRDISRSLFTLIAIPYIRAKALDYYESLGGGLSTDITGEAASQVSQTPRQRFQLAFKKIYPVANIAFELWLTSYNIAYLFEKTSYYRPWLAWMGLDLRRVAPSQTKETQARVYASTWQHLKALFASSPRLLLDSLKVLLPLSIFFLKFLEWWYSPSSPARALYAAPSGPAIPPPQMLLPHPDGLTVDPTRYGECPICHQQIVNATALPTGYVFCYRCIHPSVETTGLCPVTLHPISISQLRKIMI